MTGWIARCPLARRPLAGAIALLLASLVTAACGERGDGLSGRVTLDGSSTVYPISEAVAEEFQIANPGTRVTVGVSGTGGGFQRFCTGETDISNASREMAASERELCEASGIEWLELPVARDGLTVAVNSRNEWASCITVEELERLWQPGSDVTRWSQIREEWPDREIALYGPDTDSGTFDYFTEVIMGTSGASRSDYTASADDNVLVQGVAGDVPALGYFGFAYYIENETRLKALGVDGGAGCVEPTRETIGSGEYEPLSRPMYIYVKRSALERPAVHAFVGFYLRNAAELASSVGYVPLPEEEYAEALESLPAFPDTAAGATPGANADSAAR